MYGEMGPTNLDVIKDIPGYKVILKAVIKNLIQQLVEQLASHADEESVILTASISDGSLSHLGTESGKSFLHDNEDIKSQFLGFCLRRHHKLSQQKSADSLLQPGLSSVSCKNTLDAVNLKAWTNPGKSPVVPGRTTGLRHEPYRRGSGRGFIRSGILAHHVPATLSQNTPERVSQDGDTTHIPVSYSNTVPNKSVERSDSPHLYPTESAIPFNTNSEEKIKTEPVLTQSEADENSTELVADFSDSVRTDRYEVKVRQSHDEDKPASFEQSVEYSNIDDSMSDGMNGEPMSEINSSLSGNEEVSVKVERHFDSDSDLAITGVETVKNKVPHGRLGDQRMNSQMDDGYGASSSVSHHDDQDSFNSVPIHDDGSPSGPHFSKSSYKGVSCELCGKVLSTLANLRRHIRIHQGLYPYQCTLCDKRFSDASNCKKHQFKHLINKV